MLASEINHPLPQVVLTADKKMFTDRNKYDTSIERRYISPWLFPRQKNSRLAPSLVDVYPARAGNATASWINFPNSKN